jgi:hypothetical protein
MGSHGYVSSCNDLHPTPLMFISSTGCDVEEYPFGNSQSVPSAKWSDRDFDKGIVFPVLRLIPHAENMYHGTELGRWIRQVKSALKKQQQGVAPQTFTYCKCSSHEPILNPC